MTNTDLKRVIGYALAASLALAPLSALAKDNAGRGAKAHAGTSTSCVKAFGHLVAPGWIARTGTTTVDSHCTLPFGIRVKLGLTERPPRPDHPATTTPDTRAPAIFLVFSNTGTSTAHVTWFTNERADSQVAYGTTTAYGSKTPVDTDLTFFHSMTIDDLEPSTTYHFQIHSKDASGNRATSSAGLFVTGL